jgi:hypothetical protein
MCLLHANQANSHVVELRLFLVELLGQTGQHHLLGALVCLLDLAHQLLAHA